MEPQVDWAGGTIVQFDPVGLRRGRLECCTFCCTSFSHDLTRAETVSYVSVRAVIIIHAQCSTRLSSFNSPTLDPFSFCDAFHLDGSVAHSERKKAFHHQSLFRPHNMAAKFISDRARRASETVNNASEDYEVGRNCSDLPEVFHKVAQALPVAQECLQAVCQYFRRRVLSTEEEESLDEKKKAVSKVQAGAQELANVFQKVIDAEDGDREAVYQEHSGEDKQVEVLMKGVLEAILVLAQPPAVTDEQREGLEAALSDISKIQSKPTGKKGASINYYGSGTQAIHQGKGHQNINPGKGNQFIGTFGTLPFKASAD